eukprot:g2510.t1
MRYRTFLALTIFSLVALAFQVIIILGTTHSNSNVEKFSWARGTWATNGGETAFDMFVGSQRVLVKGENAQGTPVLLSRDWEDTANCSQIFESAEVCTDCEDAASSQTTSAYTGIVAGLGQLHADWSRRSYAADFNCVKFVAMLSGFVGILTNIIAIGTFYSSCVRGVEDASSTVFEVKDMTLGPGMILLVLSTLIKVANTAVHAAYPTPIRGKD